MSCRNTVTWLAASILLFQLLCAQQEEGGTPFMAEGIPSVAEYVAEGWLPGPPPELLGIWGSTTYLDAFKADGTFWTQSMQDPSVGVSGTVLAYQCTRSGKFDAAAVIDVKGFDGTVQNTSPMCIHGQVVDGQLTLTTIQQLTCPLTAAQMQSSAETVARNSFPGTAFGSLLTAVNGAEQCASSPNLIENSGAIVNSILIAAQAEGSYSYAEAPAPAPSVPQAKSAEGAPEEGPVTVGTAYTLPDRGQYASRVVASPEAAPAPAPLSPSY